MLYDFQIMCSENQKENVARLIAVLVMFNSTNEMIYSNFIKCYYLLYYVIIKLLYFRQNYENWHVSIENTYIFK